MLLLFPGSNLRAARGEERHIDDEKNAFVCVCVCVCVRFVTTICAYEFVLFFVFFRFFDLYYKMSCLLLVRQSRRFEQTKRKNTLTTRGSANIYVHAHTLPWRLQIPFVQNSVFLWKRESTRARSSAREFEKKSKELVSRRTHYRGSGNKGIRSQLCHFMRVMHKARSTPLSTHFLLFESALFAFLLTFSRAHARCFPRFVFLRASHPAYE